MLRRIFPARLDGPHEGLRLAIWLLAALVLVKGAMGLNSLFNARFVATTADGIPLESYGGGGAEAVVAFFAVWGLGQVIFALLGVLALVRYRPMIPIVLLLFLVEHLGRKAVFAVHPIARAVAPAGSGAPSAGAIVNHALLAAMAIGLAASLLTRKGPAKVAGDQ